MSVSEKSSTTSGFREVFGSTLFWFGVVCGATSLPANDSATRALDVLSMKC